jgi:DNA-binding NarL/FixJ family response regulator
MPLTERERQVLDQVMQGLTSREIAQRLGLSPKTIQCHREHIMRKLDVHNAIDLARKVIAGLTHDVAS